MDRKAVRAACRVAVAVAIDGEQAEPRIAAPKALRPVLGFSRLSNAAYSVIQRVIDDDGIFRARVAEVAEESDIGRIGWLWLNRPVGWLDEVAEIGATGDADGTSPSPPVGEGKRDQKAAVARLRKAAADADAARRRAADQLAEVRRSEAEVRAERDALAGTIATLQDQRNAAVRRSKELEASLAEARRDLKLARQATTDAEVELQAARDQQRPSRPADPAAPREPAAPRAPVTPPAVDFDRAQVSAAVRSAATAAADLAAALADASAALAPAEVAASPPTVPKKRSKRPVKRPARAHPDLPPGVFDGTPEAERQLISSGANLLIVDGYNLSKAAWLDLSLEEERRRTVAVLDDVQARSGGTVIVIFDGDSSVIGPKASRNVQVRYSASGQTADDAISELIAGLPASQPIVVVSSDRAVVADARRQGAVTIGSRSFLAAAGR